MRPSSLAAKRRPPLHGAETLFGWAGSLAGHSNGAEVGGSSKTLVAAGSLRFACQKADTQSLCPVERVERVSVCIVVCPFELAKECERGVVLDRKRDRQRERCKRRGRLCNRWPLLPALHATTNEFSTVNRLFVLRCVVNERGGE